MARFSYLRLPLRVRGSMSDLATSLESLRLRVEMLRAGKRARESGDYAGQFQFMDRRIPLLYETYCKGKMMRRTVGFATQLEVSVEKIWEDFGRLDSQIGYKISRAIEGVEHVQAQVRQAMERHESQGDTEQIIRHLQYIFYLMLFFNVVYEIFNKDLNIVKACNTFRVLTAFNSGEPADAAELIDLCYYYSCEGNDKRKQKNGKNFQKQFRRFYQIPEDSSVTRWAGREVSSL